MKTIQTGKDITPFWNEDCKTLSNKLWLPTDNPKAPFKLHKLNSWFSIHIRTNKPASSLRIYKPIKVCDEEPSKGQNIKIKRIRIKPNSSQEKVLRDWIGSARNAYNYVISKTHEHSEDREATYYNMRACGLDHAQSLEVLKQYTFPSWMELKNKSNRDFWESREDWLSPIPSKCFTQAFKQACDVRRAILLDKGSRLDLKFRSSKSKIQSCYIPKSAIKEGSIFRVKMKRSAGEGRIPFTEKLPRNFLDSELVFDHDQWFLCVPYKEDSQLIESQDRVVALDVGIRKFLTFYSEDNCGFIGKNVTERIFRLAKAVDQLVSKITKSSGKFKKRLKVKADRIRVKIKNLVKELHYKTCDFLVNNFDLVLLPHYEVKDFVISSGRKLNNKSVRKMLSLSFYKFSQTLTRKFNEKKGFFSVGDTSYSRVVRVNEAYTSKTQTWDGNISDVGSKESLKINNNVTIDRDINGARNIFLRALVDSPILRDLTFQNDIVGGSN